MPQHERHRDGVLFVVAEHLFGGQQVPDPVGHVAGDTGQLALRDEAVAEGALFLEMGFDLPDPVDCSRSLCRQVIRLGTDNGRKFSGVRDANLAKSY